MGLTIWCTHSCHECKRDGQMLWRAFGKTTPVWGAKEINRCFLVASYIVLLKIAITRAVKLTNATQRNLSKFIIIIHIAEWWCCTLFHIRKPQKGLHNVSHEAFGGDKFVQWTGFRHLLSEFDLPSIYIHLKVFNNSLKLSLAPKWLLRSKHQLYAASWSRLGRIEQVKYHGFTMSCVLVSNGTIFGTGHHGNRPKTASMQIWGVSH